MKIIAFYLPQFHQIPENDRWWGSGFTEWTNTRKAKPLFKNHYQPRSPLNNNFYDLQNPEAMKWQIGIAKEYGVFGFCFYHYWFNGKKLLEKPIEALLESKKDQIPFCLSWANESWCRTWDGRENDILMTQNYGNNLSWKRHISYLLPYFLDDRYIKINGEPIFLIYRSSSIPNVDDMISEWQDQTIKAGLPGIYIIETMNNFQKIPKISTSSAVVEFEPGFSIMHDYSITNKIKNRIRNIIIFNRNLRIKDFSKTWETILNREINDYAGRQVIPGGFSSWDNSPRQGKKALIIHGSTPQKFKHFMNRQIERARNDYKSEFLFFNAWNEWAEGAYLEPDEKYEFAYLQVIRELIGH